MKQAIFQLDDVTEATINEFASERTEASIGRKSARSATFRDMVAFAKTYRALFTSFVAMRSKNADDSEDRIIAIS